MRKRFAEVSNTLTFTPFGAFFYETALFCSFWKPKPCAVLRVKGDGTLQSTCFVAQTIAPPCRANVLGAAILADLAPSPDSRRGRRTILIIGGGRYLQECFVTGGNVRHAWLRSQLGRRFLGQSRARPAVGDMPLDVRANAPRILIFDHSQKAPPGISVRFFCWE
jgi:hypothetical protein